MPLDEQIEAFLRTHWRISIINEGGVCRAGVFRPIGDALRWQWCSGETPRAAIVGLIKILEGDHGEE